MNTDWLPKQLTNTTERMTWVRDSVKAFTLQQYLSKTLDEKETKTLYLFLIAFTKARKTGPHKYKDIKTKNNIIDAISKQITKINQETGTKWGSKHRQELLNSTDLLKRFNFITEASPQEIMTEYPWMKDLPIPKRGKGLHYKPSWATFNAATVNPRDPVLGFAFTLEQIIHYLGIIVLPEHKKLRNELAGTNPTKKSKSTTEQQAELILALMELGIYPQKLRDDLNAIKFEELEKHEELFRDHPLIQAVTDEKKVALFEKILKTAGISVEEYHEQVINKSKDQGEVLEWLITKLAKNAQHNPKQAKQVSRSVEEIKQVLGDTGLDMSVLKGVKK